MKKIVICLIAIINYQLLVAQSVGIGTTAPNASAQLDVTSTTKGLLIPSMTLVQRVNIVNPAEGLIVYDLTNARLYQYNNGEWRYFINNDYWVKSTTRQRVYNTTDSIGIGTAFPVERLHVAGNIKATGDILTTGEIIMNNPTSILQMENLGVNRSFIQLSGDNLRMGTNSGNTTGSMIIQMNGTNRVTVNEDGKVLIGAAGVSNPTPDLDVTGTINVSGTITKTSVTGGAALLPFCYGTVSETGTVLSGTGNFTATRISVGRYRIFCTGVTANSVVIVNAIGKYQGLHMHLNYSAVSYTNYFEIKCWDNEWIYNGFADAPVQFIVFK